MALPSGKTKAVFRVSLSSETTVHALGQPIMLTCKVDNEGDGPAKFCRYMTPFEGFNGDILDITDGNGAKAKYLGPMKKRSKPTAKDDIHLAAGESLKAEFDLASVYDISKAGAFTVMFKGNSNLNGLPNSNSITLTVK